MTTKLRIGISDRVLEIEGSENFVLTVYNDFKERLNNSPAVVPPVAEPVKPLAKSKPSSSKTKTATVIDGSKSKKKAGESPTLDKDLDLSGKGKNESLKSFYGKYEANSFPDKNLIFIYYLEKILDIKKINQNQVFTCYREVNSKIPIAFRQSLLDTSGPKKGWIEASDNDNLTVTTRGLNYIEHEFPKKVDAK